VCVCVCVCVCVVWCLRRMVCLCRVCVWCRVVWNVVWCGVCVVLFVCVCVCVCVVVCVCACVFVSVTLRLSAPRRDSEQCSTHSTVWLGLQGHSTHSNAYDGLLFSMTRCPR
jgi:uncharacterized membrane protein